MKDVHAGKIRRLYWLIKYGALDDWASGWYNLGQVQVSFDVLASCHDIAIQNNWTLNKSAAKLYFLGDIIIPLSQVHQNVKNKVKQNMCQTE